MYNLQLANSLLECPHSWIKMIRYLQSGSDDSVPYDVLNLNLAKFNGVYHRDRVHGGYVEFESEEDAIVFSLTWS